MSDRDRIEKIMNVLIQYTTRDFSETLELSEETDELDTISMGINILGEELKDYHERNEQLIHFLKEKNQELSHFAHLTSHDLQEPIRTILAFNQLVVRKYGQTMEPEEFQYLKFINSASKRMKLMVDGLLLYSKLGEKRELQPIDPNNLILEIKRELLADNEEVSIKLKADDINEISSNRTELKMVFKELLNNSIKFRSNKESVKIEITYSKNSKMHKITIKDDGIGITPKYAEKVFVMFQKLNDHHKYQGIGAGLAYCKKIINLWGGDIWVNPNVTKGSEVTFTVPIHQYH